MAQLMLRYPVGSTMVNGKIVENRKLAEKLCRQFDEGKSIALPGCENAAGFFEWMPIIVDASTSASDNFCRAVDEDLSSTEEAFCEACLAPVGGDRVMVDDLVYLCQTCNYEPELKET